MNISYNDNLFCQMLRFQNVYHRCLCFIFYQTTTDGPRTKVSKNTLLFTYSTNILVRFRWGQGAGARENRGREAGVRETGEERAGSGISTMAGSGREIQKGKLSLFVTAYIQSKKRTQQSFLTSI